MAMFQIYANALTSLMTEIQALEDEISTRWGLFATPAQQAERTQKVNQIISNAYPYSNTLSFMSTARQLERIEARLHQGPIPHSELAAMFTELRVRIGEDLQDRVFYCISDPTIIHRFFKRNTEEPIVNFLITKSTDEIFDSKVIDQFPEIEDDIVDAAGCFIHDRHTGCVFHLMRIVECGLLQVAKLGDITDPKPSWGAILQKLDKYAYRTDYKDLPTTVQSHMQTIKNVLPTLHAIQHSWRNKITHVENRLIPVGRIIDTEALDIMNAVRAFMRTLAIELEREHRKSNPAAAPSV